MGTELHEAVLGAISKIGKHMTEAQNNPQMQVQNLLKMLADLKAKQPQQGLAGAMGAPGAPPPTPPALTPPPAPPGAAMAA